MRFLKLVMGFYSPYSWTKWIRMSFAAIALYITYSFWSEFYFMVEGGGIIGLIIALVIFVLIGGPTIAALLGVSVAVGAIIGAVQSGKRQAQSLKESKATGDQTMADLDKLRIKVQIINFLFYALIALWLISGIILPVMNGFGLSPDAAANVWLFGGPVLIIVFWFAKSPINKRYKSLFKENIVIKGLQSVLPNMEFNPSGKLDESYIRSAGLFARYDLYDGNDYLAAEHKGIGFMQSDVHLREEHTETYTDSDGDRQTRTGYTTIFRGRLMVFDYDAISDAPVAVFGKKHKTAREEILSELDAFNRKFSISAADATTAFRILTPPVLEGIVLASDKMGCPIALSFKDDKLYVAISNGDTFEASAAGDATLSEQRSRIAWEIQTVLDMVETLYLKK